MLGGKTVKRRKLREGHLEYNVHKRVRATRTAAESAAQSCSPVPLGACFGKNTRPAVVL